MALEKMDHAFQKVEKYLMFVSWIATLFITFMIIIDIFLRFVFNQPLPATWEMSEVVMPYIVLFALSYTLAKDVHVRMYLVTNLLPPKARWGCELFSIVISIVFCAMMTYWSWLFFWESYSIGEDMLAAIKIPWWLGKFAMPVGMAAFSIRFILKFFSSLAKGLMNSTSSNDLSPYSEQH